MAQVAFLLVNAGIHSASRGTKALDVNKLTKDKCGALNADLGAGGDHTKLRAGDRLHADNVQRNRNRNRNFLRAQWTST